MYVSLSTTVLCGRRGMKTPYSGNQSFLPLTTDCVASSAKVPQFFLDLSGHAKHVRC